MKNFKKKFLFFTLIFLSLYIVNIKTSSADYNCGLGEQCCMYWNCDATTHTYGRETSYKNCPTTNVDSMSISYVEMYTGVDHAGETCGTITPPAKVYYCAATSTTVCPTGVAGVADSIVVADATDNNLCCLPGQTFNTATGNCDGACAPTTTPTKSCATDSTIITSCDDGCGGTISGCTVGICPVPVFKTIFKDFVCLKNSAGVCVGSTTNFYYKEQQ